MGECPSPPVPAGQPACCRGDVQRLRLAGLSHLTPLPSAERPACFHCIKSAHLRGISAECVACYYRLFDAAGDEIENGWPAELAKGCTSSWVGPPPRVPEPAPAPVVVKVEVEPEPEVEKVVEEEAVVEVIKQEEEEADLVPDRLVEALWDASWLAQDNPDYSPQSTSSSRFSTPSTAPTSPLSSPPAELSPCLPLPPSPTQARHVSLAAVTLRPAPPLAPVLPDVVPRPFIPSAVDVNHGFTTIQVEQSTLFGFQPPTPPAPATLPTLPAQLSSTPWSTPSPASARLLEHLLLRRGEHDRPSPGPFRLSFSASGYFETLYSPPPRRKMRRLHGSTTPASGTSSGSVTPTGSEAGFWDGGPLSSEELAAWWGMP